jgi:hypothetical protein
MATSSSDKIVDEIAERIAERQRVYDAALAADMTRLCRTHGADLVAQALERLNEPPRSSGNFDARAHRQEVSRAISRLLQRRAEDPERFGRSGDSI